MNSAESVRKITRVRVVLGTALAAVTLEVIFFAYSLGSFLASSHNTVTFGAVVVTAAGALVCQCFYLGHLVRPERHRDYRWHRRVEFYPLGILTFLTVAMAVSWVLTLFQSFSAELWEAVRAHATGWVRVKLSALATVWVLLGALNWALALFHHHSSKSNVLVVRNGDTLLAASEAPPAFTDPVYDDDHDEI